MDIFGGPSKIYLYLGVISVHFRVFSSCQGTEWGILLGVAKISNIFLGCLKFLIFFGVSYGHLERIGIHIGPLY